MGIAATLDVKSVRTVPLTDQRYVVLPVDCGFSYVQLKATVEGAVRTISPLFAHRLAFASSVISALHSDIANTNRALSAFLVNFLSHSGS